MLRSPDTLFEKDGLFSAEFPSDMIKGEKFMAILQTDYTAVRKFLTYLLKATVT